MKYDVKYDTADWKDLPIVGKAWNLWIYSMCLIMLAALPSFFVAMFLEKKTLIKPIPKSVLQKLENSEVSICHDENGKQVLTHIKEKNSGMDENVFILYDEHKKAPLVFFKAKQISNQHN